VASLQHLPSRPHNLASFLPTLLDAFPLCSAFYPFYETWLQQAAVAAWAAPLGAAVCQLLVELARVLVRVRVLASGKMGKMGEFYLRARLCRCSPLPCQVRFVRLR
jgi:hypothetical protein